MLLKKIRRNILVSVIILDNGEPNVIQLTFENLYKELKDIQGSELLIKKDWFDIEGIRNRYVCFVEADCLISPNYFKHQLEGFKKRGYSRLTGVMSSATGVNQWENKIFGYKTDKGVMPSRNKKSSSPYPVQIAYIPGAIIRMTMLKTTIKSIKVDTSKDLVYMSTELSLAFWKKGYRVIVNPFPTYVTTEDYVNDIGIFPIEVNEEVRSLFNRESI